MITAWPACCAGTGKVASEPSFYSERRSNTLPPTPVAFGQKTSGYGLEVPRDMPDLVLAQRHAYFFSRDMTHHLRRNSIFEQRMNAASIDRSSPFFKDYSLW